MTINWLAVIVATVASWALGAAWYMAFSKQWLAAIGKTRDQIHAEMFRGIEVVDVCLNDVPALAVQAQS